MRIILLLVWMLASASPIKKADFGAAWPFTIESGELRCEIHGPRQFVILRSGGVDYGVNGSAKQFGGYRSADSITRRLIPSPPKNIVSRIALPMRRTVFAALANCDDKSDEREQERCRSSVLKTHKLSAVEIDRISEEGVTMSWPPLSPPQPMDVSPIIKKGLALCSGH